MLDELTMSTESYVDEFLRTNFGNGAVIFDSAETSRVNFVAPGRVDFETTISFFPAAIVPSTAELNNAVRVAFLGIPLQDYISRIQMLPQPNVFRQTTSVEFALTAQVTVQTEANTTTTMTDSDSTEDSGSNTTQGIVPELPLFGTPRAKSEDSGGSPAGLAAAASAGAFILVVAGYLVYRRSSEEVELAGKFIDPDGHMTVTGDTYIGGQSVEESTCVGGQSTDTPADTPQPAYRSETPEWKEYHSEDKAVMSETEWGEYQQAIERDRSESESPFEAIPEEKELNLPYGEDDESFPDRILSELDDVTL